MVGRLGFGRRNLYIDGMSRCRPDTFTLPPLSVTNCQIEEWT
jgi:hypothetical protein